MNVRLAACVLSLLVPAAASAAVGTTRGHPAAVAVPPTQLLVTLRAPHEVHAEPRAHSVRLGTVRARTPITAARTVLPVLGRYGAWLEVRLPGRPNGHTGWIHRRAATESFTPWHVVVRLRARTVTVYFAGHSLRRFWAVVGRRATPTPAGQFFVEESVTLPAAAPGAPFAFALSARSDVLQEFDGGPGQIALHGVANIGGVPGTAASHGCVRMTSEVMRWLAARIAPGVPVTITR